VRVQDSVPQLQQCIHRRNRPELWEKTRGTQKRSGIHQQENIDTGRSEALAAETNKSAITDHVAKENHVINWSGAKILDRESHLKTRQLKESICIGEEANCINRDGGAYTYDL